MATVLHQPDHAYDRTGMNRSLRFVVKADIASHDWCLQAAAGFAHSIHGLFQLPEDLQLLRAPEVEAIGDPQRLGTGADHVARRFGDGDSSAFPRIQVDVTAVTIGG